MARLFRRILVPHDFSDHAARALALAVDLAVKHGGRLTVLHAVAPVYTDVALAAGGAFWAPPGELLQKLQQRLESLVARATRRRRVRTECRVVMGRPFVEINAAARRADVIVMGTSGRTGLSHVLLGSVAERVVRRAPVPVLTVRAEATRAGGRRPRSRRR